MVAKVIPLKPKVPLSTERTLTSSTIEGLEKTLQYLPANQQFNTRMLIVADLLVRSIALDEFSSDERTFLLSLVEGAYRKGMAMRVDRASDNS